ncbi:hypothetical protein IV417_11815 [Alphaproteobacteria bacterium KMM 3653]|uniref:Uncharacterized protein n=1 Tax=Harenicola maris TaxID=2841044 RepID=A0AAP2G498_9RHOB|nr:hypothetical protein [Harenicola maris]
MKLLVLGDSHTASIKFGWDEIKSAHPGKELSFFALPGERIRRLVVREGRLVMSEKAPMGNRAKFEAEFPAGYIDLQDYDAVLLVGLIENMHSLILSNAETDLPMQAAQPAQSEGLLSKLRRGRGTAAGRPIGTRAMFEAAWADIFQTSKLETLLRRLDKMPPTRCFLTINPHVTEKITSISKTMGPAYRRAAKEQAAVEVLSQIAAQGLARNLPEGVELIAQPEETVVSGCMTGSRFTSGAEKYYGEGETFGKKDIYHANRAYGILILEEFFARLAADEGRDT